MGHLDAVAVVAWEDNHPARRDGPVPVDEAAADAPLRVGHCGAGGVLADEPQVKPQSPGANRLDADVQRAPRLPAALQQLAGLMSARWPAETALALALVLDASVVAAKTADMVQANVQPQAADRMGGVLVMTKTALKCGPDQPRDHRHLTADPADPLHATVSATTAPHAASRCAVLCPYPRDRAPHHDLDDHHPDARSR